VAIDQYAAPAREGKGDPLERTSEVLFGVIMVLTFTSWIGVVLVAVTMALGG
jgi:hypothetical protein